MFERLEPAPPDAILGLTEAFRADTNPHKVNLSVGQYQDDNGKTTTLKSVLLAEKRLLETEVTKGYLPIDGDPTYGRLVQELLFGSNHPIVTEQRAAVAQTPGGTGGLRVAAEFAAKTLKSPRAWFSDPTWPNHPSVFAASGMQTASYAYYDAPNHGLARDAMLEQLKQIPAGDLVVLHGCCHNPTGVDLTDEDWRTISQIAVERGWLPLIDFAYQGFSESLQADASGVKIMSDIVPDLLVCSSFSKNFGLYRERVGALTVVSPSKQATQAAQSWVKSAIRTTYSNPPYHGAGIVATVLSDPELRGLWETELDAMRNRINGIRKEFCDGMAARVPDRDFSFIAQQRGMFSFSGLTPSEVKQLRDQFAIYAVGSGRINVAGMTRQNLPVICDAIAKVLKS